MDDCSARSFNHKRFTRPENELSELIWRNGHVVMQSQSNKKPLSIENESKLAQEGDEVTKLNLIQDDETVASWFPCVLDEFAIDKEFASYFFCDAPIADDVAGDTQSTIPLQESTILEQPIPSLDQPCAVNSVVNFSQFARPLGQQRGDKEGSSNADRIASVGESSSMISIELSVSGSNQVQNQLHRSRNMSTDINNASLRRSSAKEDIKMSVPFDARTVSSSSGGGSGCSFGRIRAPIDGNQSRRKRKGRDVAELECHSEDIEDESFEANKLVVQQSTSARRSRAAEVHNLSERRRRDRINEKMRALQELIPHCNKSDKASMLDEAIEYLKSLQQQVQIMWMGSGMAPMIFPGFQQYMSMPRVGIGMGIDHASMPSIPRPIQLPGLSPLLNQSVSTHFANQPNFLNPMQNVCLPDQYAYHRIVPQAMMNGYGSQTTQLNQTAASSNLGRCSSSST